MDSFFRKIQSHWLKILVATIIFDWLGGFNFILSNFAIPQRVVARHAEGSCYENIDGVGASRDCSTVYFHRKIDNQVVDIWWCTSDCRSQAPLTISGNEYLMFHIALPFAKSIVTGIEQPP